MCCVVPPAVATPLSTITASLPSAPGKPTTCVCTFCSSHCDGSVDSVAIFVATSIGAQNGPSKLHVGSPSVISTPAVLPVSDLSTPVSATFAACSASAVGVPPFGSGAVVQNVSHAVRNSAPGLNPMCGPDPN